MSKTKKIAVVFSSCAKDKSQETAEEITVKLVKNTLYKQQNNIY